MTIMNMNGEVIDGMATQIRAAELKGLLQNAIDQGLRYVILNVDRKFFKIDPSYQTPERTERDITSMIDNWDENKLLPLTVVPHFETGDLMVVDGSKRLRVSEIKGYNTLPAMILLTAPQGEEERRKFEASLYISQIDQVDPLKPIQKHGGRVVIEDPAALALDEAKEKWGLIFSKKKGNRDASVVGSYNQVYKMAQRYGKDGLDWLFSLCHLAGFNCKANGYSKYMVKAMTDLYTNYPDERDNVKEIIANYLRHWEPSKFKAMAVAKYPMLFEVAAVSLYMEDVYVMLSGAKQKRFLDPTTAKVKGA